MEWYGKICNILSCCVLGNKSRQDESVLFVLALFFGLELKAGTLQKAKTRNHREQNYIHIGGMAAEIRQQGTLEENICISDMNAIHVIFYAGVSFVLHLLHSQPTTYTIFSNRHQI